MAIGVKSVYLGGAINGCTDEECRDWREYIKTLLDPNIKINDPMDRDYRGSESDNVTAIVEGDKADIDDSFIVVINYEKPSVGTSMETLYAWEREKVIILITPEGIPLSPWLRYHTSIITHSYEEAACLIRRLFE